MGTELLPNARPTRSLGKATFPLRVTAPRGTQQLWLMSRRGWETFPLAKSHPGANSNSSQALRTKQAGTAVAAVAGTSDGDKTALPWQGQPVERPSHAQTRLPQLGIPSFPAMRS